MSFNKTLIQLFIAVLIINSSCKENGKNTSDGEITEQKLYPTVSLVVLGNVQDAGSPHIGCKKDCCAGLFDNPDHQRKVVSLGLYDSENNKKYLFEATPDIVTQAKTLKNYGKVSKKEVPDGVFLTHAHIGHYAGLMYFGKEAMNAKKVPVYTMPAMNNFLKSNGPWSQLVSTGNIKMNRISNDSLVSLTSHITVRPFTVPHRDEFSETVGYQINGPEKKALFIPDIDKWEKWDIDIVEEIKKVDYAFLDATFFDGDEINNRDISEIPHPFVVESMEKFSVMDELNRNKVIFIHFNHTNPILVPESKQSKEVLKQGFKIARFGEAYKL